MPACYAELRVKSAFSFLRGASLPSELCERAADLELAALGIADRNSLAGLVRAHVSAKALGLPLLLGAEILCVDAPPVLLFAQNRSGYGRLSRLITRGARRAEKGSCTLFFSELLELDGGLLALATPGLCEEQLEALKESFEDSLYLGVERRLGADDRERAERQRRRGQELGLPLVACNDVHVHEPGRQDLQDIMSCLREHRSLSQVGRRRQANRERHLKPAAVMEALFERWVPGAVARSVEFAERCHFSLDELRYEYPDELSLPGMSSSGTLRVLTEAGARRRYPQGIPPATRKALDYEYPLIEELGYESYFLTVHDIVREARELGILCQGRGSAANSAVCYCLGVTEVDPDRHELLFERFISAERGEPPDIDVDFEHERREEVIQYVYGLYGRSRVGMTATVTRYRWRSALRDVGRVFELPSDVLDRLVSAVSNGWNEATEGDERRHSLEQAGLPSDSPLLTRVIGLADDLRGLPRHLSQHVGGLVITRGRLDEIVPITNAAMEGRTVIEWDKDDLDALGILKIDILSLGMLSALRRVSLLVDTKAAAQQDESLASLAQESPQSALSAVMATDPEGSGEGPLARATYEMMAKADTVGVFQIESRAQRSMLPRLKPRCFYDLVIEVALVRPGPIQGDMVNPYLRRRNGMAWNYPHPCTESVLRRTLGVPLFQEQVMRLAVVAAGFTPAESDGLRRAMGAWRKNGHLESYRTRLMEGFASRGISASYAEQIFRQIAGFGEYGFPESHAASFALLSYASAWYKRFHPAAFAAALINSQPMGFYSTAQILRDARQHGVEVRPVDVNASAWDCLLEGSAALPEQLLGLPKESWGRSGPALRLGLRCARGLGRDHGLAVELGRRSGPYQSLSELRKRTGLGARPMRALAEADAFAGLKIPRREALWQALDEGLRCPLFAGLTQGGSARMPAPTQGEEILADLRHLGHSLRGHPLGLIRDHLAERGAASPGSLDRAAHGERLRLAGLVSLRQRPSTAKGVLFMSIEDELGEMNLIVPPKVFKAFRRVARFAPLVLAEGRVERVGEVVHLLVQNLEDLEELRPRFPTRSRNFR